MPNDRWYIWLRYFHGDSNTFAYGIYPRGYIHKSSAVRKAKQVFGDNIETYNSFSVEWKVSQSDPWRDEKRDRT